MKSHRLRPILLLFLLPILLGLASAQTRVPDRISLRGILGRPLGEVERANPWLHDVDEASPRFVLTGELKQGYIVSRVALDAGFYARTRTAGWTRLSPAKRKAAAASQAVRTVEVTVYSFDSPVDWKKLFRALGLEPSPVKVKKSKKKGTEFLEFQNVPGLPAGAKASAVLTHPRKRVYNNVFSFELK